MEQAAQRDAMAVQLTTTVFSNLLPVRVAARVHTRNLHQNSNPLSHPRQKQIRPPLMGQTCWLLVKIVVPQ